MTGAGCPKEKTKKHISSKAQRRFFYAVAGGKTRKETTMTKAQAEHHIEKGKEQKGKLPERAKPKKLYRRKTK